MVTFIGDEIVTLSTSNGNEFFQIQDSRGHLLNSPPFAIIPNKQYMVSCKILGIKGKPGCSLFGVFILNRDNKELVRRYRWINHFDGLERQYDIVFTTPADADQLVIGYRINEETLLRSEVDLSLQSLNNLQLEELDGHSQDSYDDLPVFQPLTKEEEDRLEGKIIWIFGYYRSGTTWLSRDLMSYKSIRFWNEPDIWVPLLFVSHSDSTYFFSRRHKKNWINLFRSMILRRTYLEVLSFNENVVIKDPRSSKAADTLLECLPGSKMIFLIRDGRDVIDSLIDAMMPDAWEANELNVQPIMNEKEKMDAIRAHAEAWKESVETTSRAFDSHDPDLRLLVKYEDLRMNTVIELKRIYQFLKITITDQEIEEIAQRYSFEAIPETEKGPRKFNRLATPGAWKNNFTQSEKDLIYSIIGSTLQKFGYPAQSSK